MIHLAVRHPPKITAPTIPTDADKSLLVCIVSVMVLLVGGGVSRRLRHRSIVWSLFIDQSAAHDQDLYAATSGATYDTFGGGGGWRGEFDD
jgi:hypothetical protein